MVVKISFIQPPLCMSVMLDNFPSAHPWTSNTGTKIIFSRDLRGNIVQNIRLDLCSNVFCFASCSSDHLNIFAELTLFYREEEQASSYMQNAKQKYEMEIDDLKVQSCRMQNKNTRWKPMI